MRSLDRPGQHLECGAASHGRERRGRPGRSTRLGWPVTVREVTAAGRSASPAVTTLAVRAWAETGLPEEADGHVHSG